MLKAYGRIVIYRGVVACLFLRIEGQVPFFTLFIEVALYNVACFLETQDFPVIFLVNWVFYLKS